MESVHSLLLLLNQIMLVSTTYAFIIAWSVGVVIFLFLEYIVGVLAGISAGIMFCGVYIGRLTSNARQRKAL